MATATRNINEIMDTNCSKYLSTVFKLLIDTFFLCFVEPLDIKNDLEKDGPFYYHILTKMIKFYLRDLSQFEKSNPAYSFVSNITWKTFFRVRSFIQSYNTIELSEYKEITSPEGVLITVSCRPKVHDLIILYVPNIPLFGAEPFFYVEYLLTLHSLLLFQGFDSPAIFIIKFPEICKESSMEYNLKVFSETYIELSRKYPDSKLVLMGDAMGATLILNYLSARGNVFHNNDVINATHNYPNVNLDPFACILISPIVNFRNVDNPDSIITTDYLSYKDVHSFGSTFCSNTDLNKFNPSSWTNVEIWNKLVSKGGLVITFGDKELQCDDIERMSKIAYKTNLVKIVKGKNKGHCWQLLSFMTEESQDEKEDSCFIFAGMLSRMVLYKTDKYRDPVLGHEPMNLLTIDDQHL